MPSRSEPCGLSQMIAMRYGAVPIVRSTGGLADTVRSCQVGQEDGTGYLFGDYDAGAMLSVIGQATACTGATGRLRHRSIPGHDRGLQLGPQCGGLPAHL